MLHSPIPFFTNRTSCKAVGRLAGVEGTDVYCHRNCLRYPSNCPEEECQCTDKEEVETGGEENQETQSTIVQARPAESNDAAAGPSEHYRGYPGNPVEIEPGIIIL